MRAENQANNPARIDDRQYITENQFYSLVTYRPVSGRLDACSILDFDIGSRYLVERQPEDFGYPIYLVAVKGDDAVIQSGCRWFTFAEAEKHWSDVCVELGPRCDHYDRYSRAWEMVKLIPTLRERAAALGWMEKSAPKPAAEAAPEPKAEYDDLEKAIKCCEGIVAPLGYWPRVFAAARAHLATLPQPMKTKREEYWTTSYSYRTKSMARAGEDWEPGSVERLTQKLAYEEALSRLPGGAWAAAPFGIDYQNVAVTGPHYREVPA